MRPAETALAPVPLHVVLVHPEIHWNAGNAGRTCLALGARLHLVEPLGFSLAERQVRRAGLDYWDRVDLVVWRDWTHFEAVLPSLGEALAFSAEGHSEYWAVSYPKPCVLVFGCESTGLPATVRTRFHDRSVRIPIAAGSGVRSLNLSTSVALAGYEVARQHAGARGTAGSTRADT